MRRYYLDANLKLDLTLNPQDMKLGAVNTKSTQLCYCLFSRKCYPFNALIMWTCIMKLEICMFLVFPLVSFLEYSQPCSLRSGHFTSFSNSNILEYVKL